MISYDHLELTRLAASVLMYYVTDDAWKTGIKYNNFDFQITFYLKGFRAQSMCLDVIRDWNDPKKIADSCYQVAKAYHTRSIRPILV